MSTKNETKKSSKKTEVFNEQEKAAMKEHAAEVKKTARRGAANKREEGERDIREKLAELPQPDRTIGERVHAIITENAPELMPRTWYGMPAYAKDGKVLCFFQAAQKFETRYSTLGFNDAATLDDGEMWPVAYALTAMTPALEEKIAALVKKAVG